MRNKILLSLTVLVFMSINCQNAGDGTEKLQSTIDNPTLLQEVAAFARIPSVVGREIPAAEFIRNRLSDVPVSQDALGNLVVTLVPVNRVVFLLHRMMNRAM